MARATESAERTSAGRRRARRIDPGRARELRSAVRAAVALATLLVTAACAKIEAPSGGPEDREGPKILFHTPADLSTAVPRDARVTIGFSERMDRQSVEDWLFVTPDLPVGTRDWERGELTLSFRAPLDTAATYVVLLGTGAKDRRGNVLAEPLQIAFTAGSAPAAGAISGKLEGVKQKTSGLLVWSYNLDKLSAEERTAGVPDFDSHDPDRIAQADAKGEFLLRGLVPGARHLVYALVDVDANRRYTPDQDFFCAAEDTIPAAASPVPITITVVHPREPGSIAGTVADARCSAWVAADTLQTKLRALVTEAAEESLAAAQAESIAAARADTAGAGADTSAAPGDTAATPMPGAMAPAVESVTDTLGAAARRAERQAKREEIVRALAALPVVTREDSLYCAATVRIEARGEADSSSVVRTTADRTGAYTVSGLAPGTYRVGAYRDLDGDGARGAAEPASADTTAAVRPGRTTEGVDLEIR